ncbi:EutP/PduV family microcompartment system protein [Desulfobulbus rhabdoformis]|uniref:EutP/PduV family microcompartment system protein n=1 Tax=Desulfobulbus rhabdoformis TaxID=34032 RepID=UPI001966A309|nr:EutP/PduV family microcompartment system protein [Desulfobulbus rhabdoformis]MBM9613759.1 EutP/PduV family microcompartment system protein [Desulfobulbus rhabdoformis]
MKKIMFVGQTGSGKTSLTQALNGQAIAYLKTQAVKFSGCVVDTPGEFAENRMYYSALLVSANKADIIGFIQDGTRKKSIFPPKFAAMFNKPVIGIITKNDADQIEPARAEKFLKMAGVETIFSTSAVSQQGIDQLLSLLQD